jgi:hypothetical protein
MAKTDDSRSSGETLAALRQAIDLMSSSARRLYDIAEEMKGETREMVENIATELDSKQAGYRSIAGLDSSGPLTTLTVPKEHIEMFRFGLLRELEFGGGWIKSQAGEALESMRRALHSDWYSPRERRDGPFDPFLCLGGPLREVQHDAAHLCQLGLEKPKGDVALTGEPQALKHSLESVVKYCASELSDTELGGVEMRQIGETVAWATSEAARIKVEVIDPEIARREAEREEVAA